MHWNCTKYLLSMQDHVIIWILKIFLNFTYWLLRDSNKELLVLIRNMLKLQKFVCLTNLYILSINYCPLPMYMCIQILYNYIVEEGDMACCKMYSAIA